MHVGLIYMLLATVLGRFENRKGWRIGYFILLYGFLWSYALITGLSAPVVRSAMMLSLVLSGKLLDRKGPVLNTLAGSFFLLMVINPFWITETGFQLSYLAVFGIMALHPMLLKQLEFSNIWLHRIWELVSVSLCAQIITFPVSLYYFGQFPNYFLISNLLIIPVSTLAIYGGILVMITCKIPYAGEYISIAECYLIKFLNSLTLFLGELPGAVSETGKISIMNCLVLYVIFYLMVKWMQERSAAALQKLLLSLIAWTLIVLSGL
jgi:competence protein ComEC